MATWIVLARDEQRLIQTEMGACSPQLSSFDQYIDFHGDVKPAEVHVCHDQERAEVHSVCDGLEKTEQLPAQRSPGRGQKRLDKWVDKLQKSRKHVESAANASAVSLPKAAGAASISQMQHTEEMIERRLVAKQQMLLDLRRQAEKLELEIRSEQHLLAKSVPESECGECLATHADDSGTAEGEAGRSTSDSRFLAALPLPTTGLQASSEESQVTMSGAERMPSDADQKAFARQEKFNAHKACIKTNRPERGTESAASVQMESLPLATTKSPKLSIPQAQNCPTAMSDGKNTRYPWIGQVHEQTETNCTTASKDEQEQARGVESAIASEEAVAPSAILPATAPASAGALSASSKAARWAARVKKQTETNCTTASKDEQEQARGVESAIASEEAVAPSAILPATAPASAGASSASSKAARWAARVKKQTDLSCTGPSTGQLPGAKVSGGSISFAEASSDPPAPTSLTNPALHPYVNGAWSTRPVPHSAMEAWMIRAASKQLHLPWTDKCHDYSDETLLQKKGISVHQIHAQRFHFSPPELDRSYSSIFDSRCRSKIAGLNWARSCLDSFACWRPATDTEGTRSRPWMEMDLKRDMHISGVVTQGVSKRLGLENPHVKKIQVWCRTDGCQKIGSKVTWEDFQGHTFSLDKGGDERQEIIFPSPVVVRYVRIVVLEWENSVALRAGVLLFNARDEHASRSPFVVGGVTIVTAKQRIIESNAPIGPAPANAASAPAPAPFGSKASRWAARAMKAGQPAAAEALATAPHGAQNSSAMTASRQNASATPIGESKAARWAARAAKQMPVPTVAADIPSLPPSVPDSSRTAEIQCGGKAARWAAKVSKKNVAPMATSAAPAMSLDPRAGFTETSNNEVIYGRVLNAHVQYSVTSIL